ncbi:MAG: nuclear transport factor 2 family protein [Afipia sp.]|nr:nuclear transport factor 2 family protein [Afipia sp.]
MPDIAEMRLRRLEQLFIAFNQHDIAGVMACMTPDIEFDAAAGQEIFGHRFTGQDEVKAAFEKTWSDMPDVRWDSTHHTVFGDCGLSQWIFRATLRDDRRIEANGCDIFKFRDDLICAKSAFRKERPLLPIRS